MGGAEVGVPQQHSNITMPAEFLQIDEREFGSLCYLANSLMA
jgi:hypothetical protein